MNIYDKSISNYKQFTSDNLPIRTYSPSYCQYYDRPQKNGKRCKIVVDSWEQGKILKTMTRHKSIKEQPTYYYIDIEHNTIDKLKVYLHHHKNTILNNTNVFYGTKTQAQKQLDKLVA